MSFISFLQSLVDRLTKQDVLWFRHADKIIDLVNGVFLMVREDKIKKFDSTICDALLSQQQSPNDYLH